MVELFDRTCIKVRNFTKYDSGSVKLDTNFGLISAQVSENKCPMHEVPYFKFELVSSCKNGFYSYVYCEKCNSVSSGMDEADTATNRVWGYLEH